MNNDWIMPDLSYKHLVRKENGNGGTVVVIRRSDN